MENQGIQNNIDNFELYNIDNSYMFPFLDTHLVYSPRTLDYLDSSHKLNHNIQIL